MIRRCFAHIAAILAAIPAALWIQRHEKIIARRGRPLRDEELRFARNIGIRDPESTRVLVEPVIPSPLDGLLAPLENRFGFSLGQSAGVTLGYGIYVAKDYNSFRLICHELVHVRQYEDLGGPLPFIRRYFYECLAFGYADSPMEREAVNLSGV